jgi:hypothetical protein
LVVGCAAILVACEGWSCKSSSQPTSATPNVRIVLRGSTTRRSDLPASALACANSVGVTHVHASWRDFVATPMQPVPPDRYELTLTDAPIGVRVSFRLNDQNFCDQNPTGAALRNVFVNDVALVQNTLTPGDEPGYAFTLMSDGRVTQ